MIRIDLQLAVPTAPTPDLAAIAGAAMNGSRQIASRYPQSELWEITATWDRSRYSVRNAVGQTMAKVQAVGRGADTLRVGQVAQVCYYNRDRRKPYIKAGLGWTDWGTPVLAAIYYTGVWHQSNQGPGQNSLGDWVAEAKLLFTATQDYWAIRLVDTGATNNSSIPFGLARVDLPVFEVENVTGAPVVEQYVLAAAVQRDGYSLCDIEFQGYALEYQVIGSTGYNQGDLLWHKTHTIGAALWPNNDGVINQAKFGYTTVGRWIHAIVGIATSSPTIYFSKQDTDNHDPYPDVEETLTKPAYNLSINGWIADDGYPRIIMLVPHTDGEGGSYTEVEIYEQDIDTGAITSIGSVSPQPNSIPHGHALGGPLPWYEDHAFWFTSTTTSTEEAKLVISKIGVDGLISEEETIYTPEYAPTEMTEFCWDDEATAADAYSNEGFDFTPDGGGISPRWVRATADRGADPDLSDWGGLAPVQLPAPTENTSRFGSSLTAHDATTWPSAPLTNSGHLVADPVEDLAWAVVLVPEQWQIGDGYEMEITEDAIQTYKWTYQDLNECAGYNNFGNGYSTTTYHPVWGGDISPGDTEQIIQSNVEAGCPDNPLGGRSQYFGMGDEGMQPEEVGKWVHRNYYTWRTEIRTSLGETTDISQAFDLTASRSLGKTGSVSSTPQTREDVHAADNVWDWISVPGKQILAVLRDLHADAADGNPSPHIEIYDYSAGRSNMPKLATIALGTQDVFESGDPLPPGASLGDRKWDQYFSPPRMKATAKIVEGGTDNPVIVAAVFEEKKVNSGTESGFQRVVYHTIDLSNPSSPATTTQTVTSADVGIGASASPGGTTPLAADWDSLVLAGGAMTWIRDSHIRETS